MFDSQMLMKAALSALVFIMFVPGVLLNLGGRYSLYVHAVVFALVHTVVYQFLTKTVSAVGRVGRIGTAVGR
jgi:predicted Co/Zn/Cd cation transporter (cation efflux family)